MSMTDPIADMLSRIRNAQAVGKPSVSLPHSKIKEAIARVLFEEGYLNGYQVSAEGAKKSLILELKYYRGRPVIERIERVSRPGRRVYRGVDELPRVLNGLGVAVVSTPKGVMSDRSARRARVGGEVLCIVA
ncbi:MAG: 30S ribosomal protein S8 [Hydrogenophilus sp.]|nr:30S ribosomal protein S8 [Hydrogenophilus sp.]